MIHEKHNFILQRTAMNDEKTLLSLEGLLVWSITHLGCFSLFYFLVSFIGDLSFLDIPPSSSSHITGCSFLFHFFFFFISRLSSV